MLRLDEVNKGDIISLQDDVLNCDKPVVLRGYVEDWPAVTASVDKGAACSYIRQFDASETHPVETFIGSPEINGLFFFNGDMSGYNFSRVQESFSSALDRFECQEDSDVAIYVGSVPLSQSMPEFLKFNAISGAPDGAIPRVWLNSRVTVQPHYDQSSNLACVVAGKRRFTLFPPEQIKNLYPSPLETTIAGPQLSLVPFGGALDRFPRYQEALDNAYEAELHPGDAIYIPSLWWHGVESLSDFNVLVNYWWSSGYGPDDPFSTFLHGLLTIKNLPEREKEAWKTLFDYFIFQSEVDDPMGHLPEHLQGVLGKVTPQRYRLIKNHFMSKILPQKR